MPGSPCLRKKGESRWFVGDPTPLARDNIYFFNIDDADKLQIKFSHRKFYPHCIAQKLFIVLNY